MLIYSSKSYVSEIYQHLVVPIEITRIDCLSPLIPKATFLTASVFLVHWLVVYFFIYFTLFNCSILRLPCPGCCSIRFSDGGCCLPRFWGRVPGEYCLIKVAFTSGSLTLCCLHPAEGPVFKRESNGSLVWRGASTVRRQMRQWKVAQSI